MKNPEGFLEKILKGVKRIAVPGLLIGSTILNSYPKIFGGEKTVYEKSLKEGDVKEHWIALNHMMYYLANGKAKRQGVNSQTQDLVDKLQNLDVKEDSSKVSDIYEMIFINDNKDKDKSFIYDVLAKERLPQVLTYGGFDFNLKELTDWGVLITMQGLEEPVSPEGDSWKATAKGDGNTYVAVEDPKDHVYRIDRVFPGPIDVHEKPEDLFSEPTSNSGIGSTADKAESERLKVESQHKFYNIPSEPSFDVREVKVSLRPFPKNQLLIGIYGNIKDFQTKDSKLSWEVEYSVYDKQTKMLLDSGGYEFNDDVSGLEKDDGFNRRFLTRPFQRHDTLDVNVKIKNGKKKGKERIFTDRKILAFNKNEYSLELMDTKSKSDSGQLPIFHVGPVERGENVRLYFPVGGLSKPMVNDPYSGLAAVLLFNPNKKNKGEVIVGGDTLYTDFPHPDSSLRPDYIPPSKIEVQHATYLDIVKMFKDNYLGTLPLKSNNPQAYFSDFEIKIPESTPHGMNTLYLEFYRILDPKKGTVERIGYAEKSIQVK